MNCFSLSSFLLVILQLGQSRGDSKWEPGHFKESPKPRDLLACYRSVTLDLFENLTDVVYKFYFEKAQNEFYSKTNPRLTTSFYFNKRVSNEDTFEKIIEEAEEAAGEVINVIIDRLADNCNASKQMKIMESVTKFKEYRDAKCGDTKYLNTPITRLELACPKKSDTDDGGYAATTSKIMSTLYSRERLFPRLM